MNNNNTSTQQILLEESLTIYTAAKIKTQIMALLDGTATLEIDLSKVDEIDTAGVQVLLLAKRECQSRGGELRLLGHTNAVLDVLDVCNLFSYFRDPVFIGSETN